MSWMFRTQGATGAPSTLTMAINGEEETVTVSMRECGYGMIVCASPEGSLLQPLYVAQSDQRRDEVTGLAFQAIDTGLEGESPAIGVYTYSLGEEWILVYRDAGGAIVYSISRDWGATWSMATTIAASGAHPRIHITSDNRRYVTYLSGTDVRCKLYDGGWNLVEDIGIIQGSVDIEARS